ncbi:hypothetical protein OG973_19385 [Streptomyces cyaneofuscatus]|nr:hypothetical protein OG973_19385 [Streptomyces cyaneofuscatus]
MQAAVLREHDVHGHAEEDGPDCDAAIDQYWGKGAPVSGVPSDNFGVRWPVTHDFGSGGPFTFTASAQDGALA